jgi:Flp pilus assembly protein TadG
MNNNIKSFVLRAHNDESGQVLVLVLLMLVVLLGFVAFVIDVGRLYYSYRLLLNSTEAAALAGAQSLPNPTAATSAATLYSGVSGNLNAYPNLPNVAMPSGYPKTLCLTSIGLPCLDTSGDIVTSGGANALQVKQTVSVPMTFAAMLGVKPITIYATATAAMRGSSRAPYNVAIIVDATNSMKNSDTDGLGCTSSKEACALQGVQTLLGELSPCGAGLTTCGTVTNGNVATPVDEVSLLTFPAVSSASPEYCGGGSVSVQPYPLPAAPSYTPVASPLYQIVSFSSDYRSSDSTSSLYTSSNLVKAAGTSGTGCSGLQDNGGEGTYYASVIYSAASSLLSQQSTRNPSNLAVPPTQNALIILSDGDANACYSGQSGCSYTASLASTASKTATTYPSYVDQCQQAVQAAKWASSKGITVYSVAYDSEGSGSCTTDTSNSPPINKAGITACQTMQQMASSPSKFFTSNTGCILTGGNTVLSLNAIFTAIAGDMSLARLVPNNAQ